MRIRPPHQGKNKIWDHDTIVVAIREWADLHGHPPVTFNFLHDPSLPHSSSVRREFGTMRAARLAAGLDGGLAGRGGGGRGWNAQSMRAMFYKAPNQSVYTDFLDGVRREHTR